eukprot:TRINITY_DN35354_c0_g1_i1.p1 TRINITY_DN35354_c0_g1~~TRINITY_DN35354_c0_g1_i1.p1  ORF type:complete len:115 (+),score=18.08 TRINITY_DN35354_c0_g1_i1:39-347(+)
MASTQKQNEDAETSSWVGAAAAGVGTGILNTASFAGNAVVGTASGLAGYEPEVKEDGTHVDQSWGKYGGHKLGSTVNLIFSRIGSGLAAAVGMCTSSGKAKE